MPEIHHKDDHDKLNKQILEEMKPPKKQMKLKAKYKLEKLKFDRKDLKSKIDEYTKEGTIDDYYHRIKQLINDNWDNKELLKRVSCNSRDGFPDLFKESEIMNDDKILIFGDIKKYSNKPTKKDKQNKKKGEIISLNDVNDKKPLQSVATDFNTKYFWSNKNSRMKFIFIVTFTYNVILKEFYKREKGVNRDNLNIMFKGGNVLRIVIQEFVENFEQKVKLSVLDLIGQYIKIGDYDFEVISNGLKPEIINKFNNVSYLVMLLLRNYLLEIKVFDYLNLSDEIKGNKLDHLEEDLLSTISKLDKSNFFHGIQLDFIQVDDLIEHSNESKEFEIEDDDIGYLDYIYSYRDEVQNPINQESLTLQQKINKLKKQKYNPENKLLDSKVALNIKSTNRVDFALIANHKDNTKNGLIKTYDLLKKFKINDAYIKKLTKKYRELGNDLYCSHNSLIEIDNEFNKSLKTKFQLNRIKYNYVIYYRKNIDGVEHFLKDDITGEILDVSHAYDGDKKKYKFKNPFFKGNDYLKVYRFKNYKLSYLSYSLIGLLDDLQVIIFDSVGFKPWKEEKYKKRIYRVFILYFLMFFNNYKIPYLEKIKIIEMIIAKIERNQYKFKTKSVLLNNLIIKLSNVYKNKNEDIEKFKQYKLVILSIMNKLLKIFVNQYVETRDQVLKIDESIINSDNLNL